MGLDLGTNCGYAYAWQVGDSWQRSPGFCGQLDLSAGKFDSGAIRFVRLTHYLQVLKPAIIFYEDVKYDPQPGLTAAQAVARVSTAAELFGAFKGALCLWAETRGVPLTGFTITEIKKHAASGRANKEKMIQACNEKFGTTFSAEGYEQTGVDNIADAMFVLDLGLQEYGLGQFKETA